MKKSRFLMIVLAVILSSCAKTPMVELPSEDGEGYLRIGLSVDESLSIVQSKADDMEAVPEVDSLYVELYRYYKWVTVKNGKETVAAEPTWNRLYFGKYEDAKDSLFRVNAGQWKMVAFHGDSTACGFDKPYFRAEKDFTVDGGVKDSGEPNTTYVEAEARVENVRITVNFDESVSGSFYDSFVRFARIDTSAAAGNAANKKYKQILRYGVDQEKDAYMMPTDSLQIQFMAQYEYGDESSWKFATLDTIAVNANDHLTINLSVNPRNGGLDVDIVTDNNIVKETTDFEILESWAPQDPPQIVAAGFTNDIHAVVEGDRTGNNATISVLARGGLKNFFIKIESDYLAGAGIDVPLGEEIDLANPTAETEAKLAKLRSAGFTWQADMLGSRKLTYLTMTELFTKINDLNPSLEVERNLFTISIRVVDDVDHEAVRNLSATAYPITQTLVIDAGNVWAKKIVSPRLNITRGVASLFKLQVSSDGRTWSDLKAFETANNMVLDFGTIPTSSNTKYYFRTVYNNNPNLISNVVEVTTESEQQVGNPGFEYWHTKVLKVKRWFDTVDREWYLPYLSTDTDPWWAVNSRKTMPSSTTPEFFEFKVFPCAAYSTKSVYSGEKSAMVYTVSVNDYNINTTSLGENIPGEIWIGRADDNGNHAYDGHEFSSRPASLKFWYFYISPNNENFIVTAVLKDADGNEIARVEKTDGKVTDEWEQCEIPIVYSVLNAKAASIYISFKSCSSGAIQMNSMMEIAGTDQTSHIGSVLKIDDVELTY